jgi:hypothetical protein
MTGNFASIRNGSGYLRCRLDVFVNVPFEN